MQPPLLCPFRLNGLNFVTKFAGWAFITAGAGFVVVVLALAFSRYGRIRLGQDDERPEFTTVSWFAVMFAAGMGIGLHHLPQGQSEPVEFDRPAQQAGRGGGSRLY